MPAVSVLMTRPEPVRLAPGSAAALARNPSPAFFSAAATVAARDVRSCWIWFMYCARVELGLAEHAVAQARLDELELGRR